MTPQQAQMALSQMPQGGSLSPQEAQAALAQMQPSSASQQPQNQRGLMDETGRKILATLGTFGKNIINLPNNISEGYIPPGIDPTYDYYKNLGVSENIGDKIAVGALEYAAPGAAANKLTQGGKFLSKALKSNILGGAGYGAIKDQENRLGGAALGAGAGALGYGIAKSISAAGKPVGNYITERIAKPLTEKAAKLVNYEKLAPWERTQDAMRNTFGNAAKIEKSEWKNLGQVNKKIDTTVEGEAQNISKEINKLKNSIPNKENNPFLPKRNAERNVINEKVDALSSKNISNQFKPEMFVSRAQEALEPILAKAQGNPNLQTIYKPAIDNLSNTIKSPPKSYEEAINRIQDLNAAMKVAQQAIGTKDLFLNKNVKDLKAALTQDVKTSSSGLITDNPADALASANLSTIGKQKLSSLPQTSGSTRQNKELQDFFANPNKADEAVLKNFMPKPGQVSAERMKGLGKILGDETAAKQALQRYALRDAFKNGTPDLNSLLKIYQSYSPAQRAYLFTKEQNAYLSNASKADVMKTNHGGQNFKEWYLNHKLFGAGGAIADLVGGKQAAKLFANPRGAERVMNWGENGFFKPNGHAGTQLFKSHEEQ